MNHSVLLTNLLNETPALIFIFDLLIKSLAILAIFFVLDVLFRNRLNSSSRHLLWLNALACLALMPLLPMLINVSAPQYSPPLALLSFTVLPVQQLSTGGMNWGLLLLGLYLLPAVLLSTRTVMALMRLGRIRSNSEIVDNSEQVDQLQKIRQQLGVRRRVILRYSNQVNSPVSFGLLRPQIVLPVQARTWSAPIVADVLTHELCHIRRFDWLSLIAACLLTAVYWPNPLVWVALQKLKEESENSCDAEVVRCGRSDTEYAQNLLLIAKACAHRSLTRQPALAQTMLDQNTLSFRINRILKENTMKVPNELSRAAVFFLLISTAILGAAGITQLASAQGALSLAIEDGEMLPLVTVTPQYPTAAAEQKIEGWVQVKFTVSSAGTVPVESISIVDAVPAEIFDASARRATAQFTFKPRVVNGQPVAVENVQYVFRYSLAEDSQPLASQPRTR